MAASKLWHLPRVTLGLTTGKVCELAIFGANRHPGGSDLHSGSELKITLSGYTSKRSVCAPK